MRDTRNPLHVLVAPRVLEIVLEVFLAAASLLAPITAFAQGAQHKMGPPPSAPQSTITPTDAWHPKTIAYIKASNTANDDQFGYATALSGDGNTLAVGAIGEANAAKGINPVAKGAAVYSGAVYIYTRTAAGWRPQAYLKASNPAAGAEFGYTLSLSNDGNLLAVGAVGEPSSAKGIDGDQSDTSLEGAGAVYVFVRRGAAWSQQAYVKASNTGGSDGVGYQFGCAVSLSSDGSTLAVGSTGEPSAAKGINGDQSDKSASESGAVYVFTHTGNTWTQQAFVKPWNTTAGGALFGFAVGLSGNGDTLAVGAQNENGTRGGVYAFTRSGGKWSQQTRFTPSNVESDDQFGCSVAISDDGNTIVAGSCEEDAILSGIQPPDAGSHDRDTDASAGAAYVFERKNGKWSQEAYMKSFNTRINDQFGWALAISRDGNTIAVGSHLEDGGVKGINGDQKDFSMEDAGAAYIYTRTGNTWSPAAYVKAPNPKPAAEFGISVALNADGKILAVGAIKENSAAKGVNGNQADTSALSAGAAYVYY